MSQACVSWRQEGADPRVARRGGAKNAASHGVRPERAALHAFTLIRRRLANTEPALGPARWASRSRFGRIARSTLRGYRRFACPGLG
jgi:hypothetical protein